jgi:hypothetical protein
VADADADADADAVDNKGGILVAALGSAIAFGSRSAVPLNIEVTPDLRLVRNCEGDRTTPKIDELMLRSKSCSGGGGIPLLFCRVTDRSSPKMDELMLRSRLFPGGGGGATGFCCAAGRTTPNMDELMLRSKLSPSGGTFWF